MSLNKLEKHIKVIFFGILYFIPLSILAQAPIRVDPSFEDSLRIVVLWNHVEGLCEGTYTPLVSPLAGTDTRNFVIMAIDTTRIRHVKIFKSATFSNGLRYPAGTVLSATTLSQVQNAFGLGKYPHVIVHINAGHTAFNGPEMKTILEWAVENYIGVVEIGDDGATLAEAIFGMKSVDNYPMPMEDAIWLDKPGDSLKICLQPERDLTKNSLKFPFLIGLITNAYNLNSKDKNLYFKPFENGGRCQADADAYSIPPESKKVVTFLGYQQGYNANNDPGDKTSDKIVGGEEQLNVIVLLQDTIVKKSVKIIRRGVILSIQPQFLINKEAAQQLIFDAVIYSSLVQTLFSGAENIESSSFQKNMGNKKH